MKARTKLFLLLFSVLLLVGLFAFASSADTVDVADFESFKQAVSLPAGTTERTVKLTGDISMTSALWMTTKVNQSATLKVDLNGHTVELSNAKACMNALLGDYSSNTSNQLIVYVYSSQPGGCISGQTSSSTGLFFTNDGTQMYLGTDGSGADYSANFTVRTNNLASNNGSGYGWYLKGGQYYLTGTGGCRGGCPGSVRIRRLGTSVYESETLKGERQ